MGAPKMPKQQATPPPGPNLLDPTVLFARQRQKQKAMQATGRQSTILSKPLAAPPSLAPAAGY